LLALCGEFRPETIYWSHSYLAAWSPRELRGTPHVVEFANIEGMRLRTLARSARGRQRAARAVEAAKAAAWEPRVARRASFCVALSEPDRDVLHGWGATAVLAPNGVDTLPYLPSPADGYALALASYDYGPNVEAVRHLVRDVWPLVRRRAPAARLVVAGRGSEPLRDEFHAVDGVSVAGSLDDVSEAYANAAVSLAPATTGGGSQLKLTESLSRGRCVVMTPFGASGLPAALRASDAYRVADHGQPFADAIVEFLDSTTVRHARERSGWQSCQSLAWSQSVAPVVEAIGLVSTAGSRP
jgi:glycosyltransferase involved in cell wall biosynthesis